MNRSHIAALALVTATLAGPAAFAAEPSALVVRAGEAGVNFDLIDARARAGAARSRADVRADLEQARRIGQLAAAGELGLTGYAPVTPAAVASGKTREQVRAEFREARRNGDVTASGEFGRTVNELTPQRFGKLG
jgi:hypothetical protein